MVQAVLTGRSTGSSFHLVRVLVSVFRAPLSSIFVVLYTVYLDKFLFITFLPSYFNELSLVGLALDLL